MEGDKKGFVLVPSGSAAALDGAIRRAYERKPGLYRGLLGADVAFW